MNNIHGYRNSTHVSHKKMAGAMSASFVCKRCRKNHRVTGRKQVVAGAPKFGYYCAQCAEEVKHEAR